MSLAAQQEWEQVSTDIRSGPVETLEGLGRAIDEARSSGLQPFTEAQTKLAGAEVYTSSDRLIRLIRQHNIQTDTYAWRVSSQSIPSSPEPHPSNPAHAPEGLAGPKLSGDAASASPQGSDAGSGTGGA